MKKEKLSAREAAWATLLMTVSSRANKPVKYMMDSTVKASDVSLGWVEGIPAILHLHTHSALCGSFTPDASAKSAPFFEPPLPCTAPAFGLGLDPFSALLKGQSNAALY
ncbi:MAG: hypothetical protein FRX49_06835 [Trebouxia sp. A1-2]|nr:MAG: hypothetical protein FRX49_06835 [Trebouxia sp. A1-2]